MRPLRDVAEINPPLDRCILDDELPVTFVPMRAVEAEGGGLLRPEVRRYGDVKKGYTAFRSGDVIMAKITPCMENGKTTVVPHVPGDVCFGSTEFHVVRPSVGIDPNWIARFLLRSDVRRSAQREMSGAVGQMRVPASFLDSAMIPVPPMREQLRISEVLDEILSDLDDAVASLERARERLSAYRASVLMAAVDGTLTAEWRRTHEKTEPAAALLEQILVERRRRWEEDQLAKSASSQKVPPKNWKSKYAEPSSVATKELAALPEGWSWVSCEQAFWRFRSGNSASSVRKLTAFPVLKSSAVRFGAIDFSSVNYLQTSQSVNTDNYLQEGDFLITRLSGSVEYVGCAAQVRGLPSTPTQYPDRVFVAKLVPGIDGRYLSYCFRHPRIRKSIKAAAKSTAGHQRISLSDLTPLAIPLPTQREQEEIVDIVEDQLSIVDHLEAELDSKLEAAQALRQAILRHAFAGQLVPQDPDDEPASELLARIAREREARSNGAGPRRATPGRKRVSTRRGA
jgi:type I restriction enzyme S subunit